MTKSKYTPGQRLFNRMAEKIQFVSEQEGTDKHEEDCDTWEYRLDYKGSYVVYDVDRGLDYTHIKIKLWDDQELYVDYDEADYDEIVEFFKKNPDLKDFLMWGPVYESDNVMIVDPKDLNNHIKIEKVMGKYGGLKDIRVRFPSEKDYDPEYISLYDAGFGNALAIGKPEERKCLEKGSCSELPCVPIYFFGELVEVKEDELEEMDI